MGDWLATFRRLVHHVRACGWTCPFVLQGQRFVPIGMTTAAGRRHHNDNRKRG